MMDLCFCQKLIFFPNRHLSSQIVNPPDVAVLVGSRLVPLAVVLLSLASRPTLLLYSACKVCCGAWLLVTMPRVTAFQL